MFKTVVEGHRIHLNTIQEIHNHFRDDVQEHLHTELSMLRMLKNAFQEIDLLHIHKKRTTEPCENFAYLVKTAFVFSAHYCHLYNIFENVLCVVANTK